MYIFLGRVSRDCIRRENKRQTYEKYSFRKIRLKGIDNKTRTAIKNSTTIYKDQTKFSKTIRNLVSLSVHMENNSRTGSIEGTLDRGNQMEERMLQWIILTVVIEKCKFLVTDN